MNTRIIVSGLAAAALATVISAAAQVVISGTESSDKTTSRSEVTVNTGDRNIVPLIKESKETKVDAATTRTEAVTRARLNDGSYFDWQRSTTVKKELSPNSTVSLTDVVENDRQGQDRVSRHTEETVNKSSAGETDQTKVYTRNSSGQLVLDRVVDANTVKASGGTANTVRVEKTPDVNGNLTLQKQIEEVAVDHGANGKVVTSTTRTADHLTGQLAVTAEETTSTTAQGGTKQIESVTRTPGPNGWEVSGRSTTTETTAPDGSVNRETIEQGRAGYSPKTDGATAGPIVPQRKIVEHEVHKSDGTTVLQRDVFHRDVNGDWKPESFSTKQADKALP
jgi:hypothetical protein